VGEIIEINETLRRFTVEYYSNRGRKIRFGVNIETDSWQKDTQCYDKRFIMARKKENTKDNVVRFVESRERKDEARDAWAKSIYGEGKGTKKNLRKRKNLQTATTT